MPNIFPPIDLPANQPPAVTYGGDPTVLPYMQAKQQADAAVQAATPQKYDYSAHGVLNNIGHVLGRVGNIAADVLDPRVTPLIPGTDEWKQNQLQHAQGQQQLATTDLENAQKESDTVANEKANREQKGELDQAKQDTAADKTNAQLAQHGYKMDPEKGIVPLSYEEMSPSQQAVVDLKQSQGRLADAKADYQAALQKGDTAAAELAKAKLQAELRGQDISLQRLGLSREHLGFEEDKQYNPQPTGAERTKGDLAQSSLHQIGEMRDVVNKRPDIFGPGPGRANKFQQWVGSSDPDAMRYRSSSQYLADHSLGLFGGRSQYMAEQLHNLTDEKFTPAAINSALDAAQKTTQGFANAGTVHGKGGKSGFNVPPTSQPGAPKGEDEYDLVNGKLVKR